MTLLQLFSLLSKVILSPEVIGVTIVIGLYINIVNYIVRYKKRIASPRKVKKTVTQGGAKNEDDEDDEDNFEDED